VGSNRRYATACAVLAVGFLTPLAARADWNQANDEANRQRMQAEMRQNAEAADRANEDSLRRNQAAYANRPQASGGSSSSNGSGSGPGAFTPYRYHSQGPASVVATYSFTVKRQESEAATVARIAAEAAAGDVQSQFNLGRIYFAGYGATPRDDAQARKWFAAAARQGHAPAQAQLGAMLYNGQGGPADRAAGLSALKQASDQGETYGTALYAVFTLEAQAKADPDQPQPQTVALLTKAADAGEVTAQDALGRIVYYLGVGAPHDAPKIIHYLTLAAAQNDAPAMFDLGSYYLGGSGVPRDTAKGLGLIRSAADLGYGDAEALLGFQQVIGGLGMPEDVDGGVRRLKSSAAHRSAQGAYYLGLLAEDGLGLPQDPAAAAAYYRTGALGGVDDAKGRYGAALIRGAGVDKDVPAGVAMIKASAEAGSSIGQTFMAKLCYEGLGVPKDRREAARWFRAAAAQGDAEAITALKDPSLADLS
jgi:TPR repeat protein